MPRARKTFALVGRFSDPRVAESAAIAVAHLAERGVATLVADDGESARFEAGTAQVVRVAESELAGRADAVLAIGGDGTLLYAARLVAGRDVPLLGINRGRLGFLTDVLPQDLTASIDAVLDGSCDIDVRPLLEARLSRAQGAPLVQQALNDVVVQKHETGRMIDFESWIDGRFVNTHGADGVVIASATGSTAYALSCGGPIVEPHLDVVVVAPICPHTLSDRPIVIPRRSTVEIALVDRPNTRAHVTVDGIVLDDLLAGDRLAVGPSPHSIRLLHPKGYDYYRLLRSKLHWGRGGNEHNR
ncbi:MAG TPA: NAD(+)/NADH kinase [Steroidobacteraceae bacterium]|nr:NAD(+)/NADH kinase [Steroidobacteraceae bacterium]HNS28276.1 NAD(+)/NADH kinase [Steroidobacteraceae bacterium]